MCLKEKLAWATDKWPWVISNIMLVEIHRQRALCQQEAQWNIKLLASS